MLTHAQAVANPELTEEKAIELLDDAHGVVESSFRRLRDEVLNSDELFEMRIALQDATDTINIATRYIEVLQRHAEVTEGAAK
ncbi:hypothetical protein UFOVP592_14 [uncultured Caudovirales phage]|uniref:Uncharacterized protein n=1 Tax=uncultured Caudovirales phage TaxID=2100421 RepID=A0A6J5MZK6_9CAUD|nr:hypothetical protein UFOVP592_14 [uncultured Caudovirales phage]